MTREIKLPPLQMDYNDQWSVAIANTMKEYATAAVELNTPKHTEAEVQELFNGQYRNDKTFEASIRRILGVPKPK